MTFNVGDPVHVEFDGKIYKYPGEYMRNTVSPNHVAVSANGFIHHIHRISNDITKIKPPRPAVVLGQVWRADDRNFLVYHDDGDTFAGLWFAGADRHGPGSNVDITTGPDEFFERYPDAELILEPNGYPVADY